MINYFGKGRTLIYMWLNAKMHISNNIQYRSTANSYNVYQYHCIYILSPNMIS